LSLVLSLRLRRIGRDGWVQKQRPGARQECQSLMASALMASAMDRAGLAAHLLTSFRWAFSRGSSTASFDVCETISFEVDGWRRRE
jgi:hypothetical protein